MSLVKSEPYHKCDFCGKEIRTDLPRYIIKEKYLTANNKLLRRICNNRWKETTYNLEMCSDCMTMFRRYIHSQKTGVD